MYYAYLVGNVKNRWQVVFKHFITVYCSRPYIHYPTWHSTLIDKNNKEADPDQRYAWALRLSLPWHLEVVNAFTPLTFAVLPQLLCPYLGLFEEGFTPHYSPSYTWLLFAYFALGALYCGRTFYLLICIVSLDVLCYYLSYIWLYICLQCSSRGFNHRIQAIFRLSIGRFPDYGTQKLNCQIVDCKLQSKSLKIPEDRRCWTSELGKLELLHRVRV